MRSTLRLLSLVVAVLMTFAMPAPSFGQVSTGSISGTAVDPQGAPISNATVTAKNEDTGATYQQNTDSSGYFRFNVLPPGKYTVELTASGMATNRLTGKLVAAGEDSSLGTVKMSAGGTPATEEAAPNGVNRTQAQVTNTFTGVTLQNFAGIQENEGLDRLALFVPGVTSARSDSFSNTNGSSLASNGLRDRNNDQQIDGQSNNDNDVSGPALFVSDPEFVQQYVLVTNQFGPEYSRNSGSVVNVITKSGTNNWHGSGYVTENNSYFNALTRTQKISQGLSGPPRSNEEFSGFTLGGPAVKNKLFLFGGFDNDILSEDTTYSTTALTPTPSSLATLSVTGCPGINANALNVITNFGPYAFPAGNPTPFGTPVTQLIDGCVVVLDGVTRTVPTPVHSYNTIGRADYLRGNDNFTTRYILQKQTFFNEDDNGAGAWVNNVSALTQGASGGWTHNFNSRMVNEARVSFFRLNVDFGGNSIGNALEPTANHIGDALTSIHINGGILGIGPGTSLPQARLQNVFQAQDNWNYVMGKHSLHAGVNWTYQRSPQTFLPSFNGDYTFSSLSTFLNNTPGAVRIASGDTEFAFREYDTFLYAGDDWRIGQNLVLNLGLTWSYYGNPSSIFNQLTTKRESSTTTAFWNPTLPLSVRTTPTVPSVRTNFGPSIGFAYSPQWGGFLTGHGKTVFRGGYRLLYDPPFYNILLNAYTSAPTTFLQTLSGSTAVQIPAVPTGPNVRASLAPFLTFGVLDPRTFDQTALPPNFGPDKVNTWSFGLEREITASTAFEARYAGNHAYNLYQEIDGNPFIGDLAASFPTLVPAGLTPCSPTEAFNSLAVGRINCNEGVVKQDNNGGYSNYNALQLEFRANNLFKQLALRTGYTWSKDLDNTSEIFSTFGAGNTISASQNPAETNKPEYGISGLNFPQVWTAIFVEQLPFFKEQRGWMGKALGQWSVSGNYIIGSGQPFTPAQEGEAAFTAAGNFYDSRFLSAFVGADSARPFVGSLSAPANQVGIFASDLCRFFFGITPSNGPTNPGACNTLITSPNQLLSFNSLNKGGFLAGPGTTPGGTAVGVTANQVRFIVNGGTAQTVFGTPFGNAARNSLTDARTNIFNLSLFKTFDVWRQTTLEIHATTLNLFNHYNFASVDPFVEDAGLGSFGRGFDAPSLTAASGRTLFVGAKFRF